MRGDEQGGLMKVILFLAATTLATMTTGWGDVMDIKSERSTAAPEGTFPKLTASNLEKQTFSLPEDFAGDRNLLLIAFQREQQQNVDTWLRQMKRFEVSSGFQYYELPTIDRLNPFFRWFINSGMRRGIPDRNARARTITLYLDKPSFRKALNLPDEKQIYAILVDRSGRVLWRAGGDFNEAKATSLHQLLTRGKQ
jgi:hypothetical protein